MIKAYRRRAFLLFALAALEPAAGAAARADNDSLWDLLTRTERPPVSAGQPGEGPAGAEMVAVRQGLGPVPGFTLPSHRMEARKKKRRAGMFGAVGNFFDHLQSTTSSKVKLSGHETLSLQWNQVSGGQDAVQSYQDQQYYGRGSNGVYNDTSLSIDATFFKYIHYQTQFSNSLFSNPNDNRFKIDYNPNRKLRLEYGDINAGITGNSLIDFNRYLYGISFKNQWTPHLATSMLYSQTRAETRTITIQGNNSSGPYYVFAGQIVPGSDRVRVDNTEMVRGQDYTLDTYSGSLNFLNGRIILQTSTIAVSFEVMGANMGASIYGIRTDYTLKPGVGIGFTYVAQQAPNSGGLLQTQTQDFQSSGSAGATYLLNYPVDLSKPVLVTANGAPLARGTEYVIPTQIPDQIIIQVAVPPGQVIEVKYFPLNTNPTVGSQSVMGVDSRLSLGKLGALTLESAFSGMMLSGTRYSGTAFQARADLHPTSKWNASLTLKDISPTYSSIQNPGFEVNERSLTLASDYSPTKRLKLNLNWMTAKRPDYSSFTGIANPTAAAAGSDDYNTYTLGAMYNLSSNSTLNLAHNSMSTRYAVGGSSSNVDDTLALSSTLRKITFDASLSHNSNTATGVNAASLLGLGTTSGNVTTTGGTSTTTSQIYNTQTDTLNKRLGVTWNPKTWFSLSGSVSDDSIHTNANSSASNSDARDMQITTSFRRIRNLTINYSYDLSDTGNLSSLLGTTGSSSTGSGSAIGTSPRLMLLLPRAYLPSLSRFALMPLPRDLTTGSTGLGTTGIGTAIGSGGSNSTLGGFGSYSGLLGNSNAYNSLYGASSFGGRNANQRLSVNYNPRQNLQVGLHVNLANSLGDYQYNSNRSDNGLDLYWQPSKRLQLNASLDLQNVQYVGGLGGTKTSAFLLALQGRPFGGKLTTTLSWTAMRTTGSLNLAAAGATGTTTGTTGATNADTNLSSLALRLDYPIGGRESLFLDILRSDSSGALANLQQNLQVGLDYSLLGNLKFSLGWQFLSNINKDPQFATENYRVSSLLAQFGLHF